MSNEQLTALLDLCRLDLQITWNDDDTNARILTYIKNGVRKIKDKTGVLDEDFNAGGKANDLFLAYVRRAMSGDTSTFEADYLSDIIALQTDYEVNEYADKEQL